MSRTKKRKKSTKNYYFTQVHEDAIVKYANTDDRELRSKLYIEYIQPAFDQMVDKIIYTYRFTTLPNIDYLKSDCKVWLTTILNKYDPSKGSKAFSYFSVITKNWFIHKVKKVNRQRRKEIQLDDVTKELERKFITTNNKYESTREEQEFWAHLLKQIDEWKYNEEEANIHSNEVRVLKAVKELLKAPKDIEILNKKAIYLYLREITGLNTKQIATCLKKFRVRYRSFKTEWSNGKI